MIVYLHGFASGPTSRKATYFAEQFRAAGVPLEIPDLSNGDFEHLTITGQLQVIERLAQGRPVRLIGSSLGGYLSALYASIHPSVQKVVLLAPAFRFGEIWPKTLGEAKVQEWRRTGKLPLFHYGEKRERLLDVAILEDAAKYPPEPNFTQPALIFHGTRDDVVPPARSTQFASTHPNARLELVDSDHELTDVLERVWPEIREFLL